MDFIELNKFSELHTGSDIIFCKTDFLFQEFENIKKLNREVVLISGNSDYAITDDIIKKAPKNIKKWFAQNALSNSDILEPIPMGLENKNESLRKGHGIGYYERATQKEILLSETKFSGDYEGIYSNFKIETNFTHRAIVKKICVDSPHILWEEPNLSLNEFFEKIKKYPLIVCPAGNGIDTHRLWEVLYSGRIPITIKMGNFKIYELYEKLPIIILEKNDDLRNLELINSKYHEIKSREHELELLDCSFWKNKIKNIL